MGPRDALTQYSFPPGSSTRHCVSTDLFLASTNTMAVLRSSQLRTCSGITRCASMLTSHMRIFFQTCQQETRIKTRLGLSQGNKMVFQPPPQLPTTPTLHPPAPPPSQPPLTSHPPALAILMYPHLFDK